MINNFENLQEYLPILIPIIFLELVLIVTALIHLFRHPKVKKGSKGLWIFIIIFFQIIGPILYFLVGKNDE